MPEGTATPSSPAANVTPMKLSTAVSSAAPLTPPTPAQQQGTEIHEGAAVPKEAPKPAGKRKLNIEGREFEIDDEMYHRGAQKYFTAEKRLAEAAKARKDLEVRHREIEAREAKAQELESRYTGKTWKAAIEEAERSGDPEKLRAVRADVEQWLYGKIQEDQFSPEQRQMTERERQIQAREDALAQKEQGEAKQKYEAEVHHFRQHFENLMLKTLEVSGLPQTEWNVKHIVDLIQNSPDRNALTPDRLASYLKEDRIEHVRAFGQEYAKHVNEAAKSKDVNTLLLLRKNLTEIYGPELLDALRRVDLAYLQNGTPQVPGQMPETARKVENETYAKPLTQDQERERRKNLVSQLDQEWRNSRRVS